MQEKPSPALDIDEPPAANLSASESKPLSSKPLSSKPRSRTPPDPDPDGAIAKQIGREIRKKIRRDCWKLGNGKEVHIKLQIGSDGRVGEKTIAAIGSLRVCIEETIDAPQFPAKKRAVDLSLVIGECIEPYDSTIRKCK